MQTLCISRGSGQYAAMEAKEDVSSVGSIDF